jgi:hypothetical protein
MNQNVSMYISFFVEVISMVNNKKDEDRNTLYIGKSL